MTERTPQTTTRKITLGIKGCDSLNLIVTEEDFQELIKAFQGDSERTQDYKRRTYTVTLENGETRTLYIRSNEIAYLLG